MTQLDKKKKNVPNYNITYIAKMERLTVMFNHLSSNNDVTLHQTANSSLPRFKDSPDDVVIVSALRTPIGKAKRGSFKVLYSWVSIFICCI